MNGFPTLGFQLADWFHSGFIFWFSLPSQLLLTTFQLLFWTTVTRSNPRNRDTERNESSPSCWDNLRHCRNVTIHGPKNKLFCLVANQSSHSQHMCLKENRKWTQRISQHVYNSFNLYVIPPINPSIHQSSHLSTNPFFLPASFAPLRMYQALWKIHQSVSTLHTNKFSSKGTSVSPICS